MSLRVQTDPELIRRYIAGEEIALEELIRRYQKQVFSFILLKVKDRILAEDLFQDTFIKVIDSLRSGNYRDEGKFIPWVLRIAHNLCIDYFRRASRHPKIITSEGKDIFEFMGFSDESKEDIIIRDQTYSTMKTLVSRLPEEQKEVVILRHYAELSFKEISEITGVSINTALGRMRYALMGLRKMMKENVITI